MIIQFPSYSQEMISDTAVMEEIVISANNIEQKRADVAQYIRTISKNYISSQTSMNAADLIQSTGEVFVQKSQQGGGSPILRGFEASRILLVVDGVRMNNIIYRAGHLQNLITIDPNCLEKIEILNGPGSTVYGSDALGGVLHFITKNPKLNPDGHRINGTASVSYHSVNNGKNAHLSVNNGWKKFGSFTAVTASEFGDLRMGSAKNPYNKDGYFGERLVYADRINDKDVLVQNDNPLIQKFSGYKQIDVLQKFLYHPSASWYHTFNFQYSTSTDVPRYDRLTDKKGNGLNSAQWYYGPQKRFLAIYNLKNYRKGFWDKIDVTGQLQRIQESRHNRGFGSLTLHHRTEEVTIGGLHIAAIHSNDKNAIRTGIDLNWNGLHSTAMSENITSQTLSPLDTRYPDGDNNQYTGATYLTHTYHINEVLTLNDGVRLGYNHLSSSFKDKTFFPFPFDEVKQKNMIYSANAGIIYHNRKIKASYMASLGFKTPNVDDMAKVFESTPGRIIVPNFNIKPEKTLTQEFNVGYYDHHLIFENVIYYTALRDFITVSPGLFDGKSTIVYNGIPSDVYTSANNAKGYIYGFNTTFRKMLFKHFNVNGALSYTFGRTKTDGKTAPLDHIPPILIKCGVEAKYNKLDATFYILANGKKKISEYGISGEDNQQYAPADGMPAWLILNIRLRYALNESVNFTTGIENIADVQYRNFASGINAPGRNIFASAKVNF
jgi:hemoglobin/transferrin/lactoferrin receptor protein